MKVHSSLMGVGGWYESFAAGWLADMRSKKVPTSTTSARRLAALIRPLAGGGSEGKPEEEDERGSSPLGPGGPFSCTQCRGAYPTREQLEKHETLHSPSTQTCNICHKTFPKMNQLQRHALSHNENPDLRKYKCSNCDKAFKHNHHLKEHLRIHSGEKPFECLNCGKRFSHSGSYSSHMTSKKCLAMNLKMGRIKTNKQVHNSDRSPMQADALQLQNSTKNPLKNDTILPILSKYKEATAFFASIFSQNGNYQPTLPDQTAYSCYAPFEMPINQTSYLPYDISAYLSYLHQSTYQEQQRRKGESPFDKKINQYSVDPEDLIEEVTDECDKRSEESAELVMDIEEDENDIARKEPENYFKSSNRFEPILNASHYNSPFKSLFQSVSKSVNTHFLRNSVENLTSISEETPSSVKTSNSLVKNEPVEFHRCQKCNLIFNNENALIQHEKLHAALNNLETRVSSIQNAINASEDEDIGKDSHDEKSQYEADRKIRARTALTDEQQIVLKQYYAFDPRPNREQFKKIAQQIGLDNRVVQVWFQNNRARERRTSQRIGQLDQPLDLSTKKKNELPTSSPSPSPSYSISMIHSDSDEAVNLSQKSSRSTTPYRTNYVHSYPHSNCSSSSITDFRFSPSPNESTNGQKRIRNMSVNPSIPMDTLLQYNDLANGCSPVLRIHDNISDSNRQTWSPSHDRPVCRDEFPIQISTDDDVSVHNKSKLKGNYGERLFACDQCDKTFVKQGSLVRHKYEHSGQRPYKCLECPKAFKHKHHLTEHKRLHTGEKPFQCCKCLKKFSHSGSYSQHMNHRFAICKPYRD